ncbi:hypothetical protein [Streptomyces sp. NPDC101150]|uniref:hypothetical protein n=1 Tax=Streptomyces sp. NPDC101150 TaxID=3366114 RepID=UPI003822830B
MSVDRTSCRVLAPLGEFFPDVCKVLWGVDGAPGNIKREAHEPPGTHQVGESGVLIALIRQQRDHVGFEQVDTGIAPDVRWLRRGTVGRGSDTAYAE